jgi:hypothetical protein
MEPTFGLIDQFTAVLVLPVTVAVNCCVPDASGVAVVGETATVIPGSPCPGSACTISRALILGF